MKPLNAIRHFLYIDRCVSEYTAEDERKNQEGVALIAAASFAIMSLLNVKQASFVMLGTTIFGAAFFVLGYLFSHYMRKPALLRAAYYITYLVVFTSYTIMGGNDGFAVLWLVIATYAVMISVDFRTGFFISLYYLVILLLLFLGPLSYLLRYDYNQTFMLRFPFLYLINFAFAAYISIRIRTYQYELLLKREELVALSTMDLSTGVKNRNGFIRDMEHLKNDEVESLVVVYIDINGLHEINNRFGHAAGDEVLVTAARLYQSHFPKDFVYRMGGDEFLILCKDSTETDVWKVMLRLMEEAEHNSFSFSFGVDMQTAPFDLDEIIKRADSKMMDAKNRYYTDRGQKDR